jgi:divalent metal cation (Fe/Co/Zn/Cd) transporter
MERCAPGACRHGACGDIAYSGLSNALDGLGQIERTCPPAPVLLSLAGAGALAVNLSCALMFARYRMHAGSLTRAAFLSARNDALANIAIVVAGMITAFTRSAWPDPINRARDRSHER